jgi:hypothetical protein
MLITLLYVFCMALRTNTNFSRYVISRLVFKTETLSVYCAVRTESLYNTDTSRSVKVNMVPTPNLASMGLISPTFSPP